MMKRFTAYNADSFTTANGSQSARASFNSILSVVDAVLAVSIFVILGILILRSLILAVLVAVILLAVLLLIVGLIIEAPSETRPSLSAA